MNPRTVIETLLEHYQDVLEGLQDGDKGGSCSDGCALAEPDRWLCEQSGCANERVIALMCKAWNHPAYRELERLRIRMRHELPRTYWHLSETYFRSGRRRIMRCSHEAEGVRCRFVVSVPTYQRAQKKPVHLHRGKRYALHPDVERTIHGNVDEDVLDAALNWLREHWSDEVMIEIPDDLLGQRVA